MAAEAARRRTPAAPYSTELANAEAQAGLSLLGREPRGAPRRPPAWTRRCGNGMQAGYGRAQRADGGFTSALKNPPAYYLYSAIAYAATGPLDLFDQLFVMRLANIPILLVMIVFTWLLAGELLGRRRAPQTLATAVVALQPQLLHLTAVVNPDLLLAAVWTVALYLAVVLLKRGFTPLRVAGLVGLCALSGLTHGRGLALVAAGGARLGLRLWKDRRPEGRPAGATAVPGSRSARGVRARVRLRRRRARLTASGLRRLGSYVWQFYLPRLGFMDPMIGPPGYGFREIIDRALLRRVRPARGRLLRRRSTTCCGGRPLLVGALAIAALVVHRRGAVAQWDVAVVLGAACFGLLALLHAVAYRALVSNPLDPIITGPLPAAARRALRRRGGARRLAGAAALGRGGRGRDRSPCSPCCSWARSGSPWSASMRRAALLGGLLVLALGALAVRLPLPDAGPRRPRVHAAASGPHGAVARRAARRPAGLPRQGGPRRALRARAAHRRHVRPGAVAPAAGDHGTRACTRSGRSPRPTPTTSRSPCRSTRRTRPSPRRSACATRVVARSRSTAARTGPRARRRGSTASRSPRTSRSCSPRPSGTPLLARLPLAIERHAGLPARHDVAGVAAGALVPAGHPARGRLGVRRRGARRRGATPAA